MAFGLAQAVAYFLELRNKMLKDLPFAIAYLYDIIIYSKIAEEHFDHLEQVFHKLHNAELTMKLSECNFLCQGNLIFVPCPQHNWHQTMTFQNSSY